MTQLTVGSLNERLRGIVQAATLETGSYQRAADLLGIGRSTAYDIATGRTKTISDRSADAIMDSRASMDRTTRNRLNALADEFSRPGQVSYQEARAAKTMDPNILHELVQKSQARWHQEREDALKNNQPLPESFS